MIIFRVLNWLKVRSFTKNHKSIYPKWVWPGRVQNPKFKIFLPSLSHNLGSDLQKLLVQIVSIFLDSVK